MTLEELMLFQKDQGMDDTHLVYFGVNGFCVAHTDLERDMRRDVGFKLINCPLHQWLITLDGPPVPVGIYVATAPKADGYSASFRSPPVAWNLRGIG